MNKLLVLGGSGRTGSLVIEKALAKGMLVHAIVRRPDTIEPTHKNLTLFEGTPTDKNRVSAAIEGCTAVISVLNNNRASDSPFAKIINSPTLMTESIGNTLAAMKSQGIKRISLLSAAGVGDSFAAAPWLMRLMIKRTNLGHTYQDHEGVEAALAASGLDWTVARAVMLGKKISDQPIAESYVVDNVNQPKPAMQISRDSVAQWLLDSLDRPELIAKAPIISQS